MVTKTQTTHHSQADKLTIQEKLLLSQAIYKLGAISWPAISKLLTSHPCCINRPSELFSPESCESIYMELMAGLEINIPAPDAMKPQAKTHLRLAQTYYLKRMEELKNTIENYENKFKLLMLEISSLKNGESDESIKNEIRTSIARKYGKRLLDTWFPDKEEIQKAIESGDPLTKEEEEEKQVEQAEHNKEQNVQELDRKTTNDEAVAVAEEPVTETNKDDKPSETKEGEDIQMAVEEADGDVQTEKAVEDPDKEAVTAIDDEVVGTQEKEVDEAEKTDKGENQDQDMKVENDEEEQEGIKPENDASSPMKPSTTTSTRMKSSSTSHQRRFSPAVSIRSELSPAPGSDLSPPPSDQATPIPSNTSTRSNKRKASIQPKGVPSSKRSGRRRTETITTSPAPTNKSERGQSEIPSEAEQEGKQEEEGKVEEAEAEPEAEAEAEVEPEVHNTRNKRNMSTRRESTRNINKKSIQQQQSPTNSKTATNKDSSPAVSTRRAHSVVSSSRSTPAPAPTPAPPVVEERRSSRRSLGTNPKRIREDFITSTPTNNTRSSVKREQSTALESVKAETEADEEEEGENNDDANEEEEAEEEKKPTRTSTRRRTGGNQEREREKEKEKETPTPAEKRGTRASARTVRDQSENNVSSIGDISGELSNINNNEPGTPNVTTTTATTTAKKEKPTQAQRSSQKLLYSLLDIISSHRNGNVFQNPVKKSEASDYYQIIKRPMDLKTIRIKIKEGIITRIDEFERDVLLIFANAMMYNDPDSQVYEMAKEMLKSTEDHIAHFKNLQHHVSR
ncbi:uncharacterized protein L201_006544 [Kwoniella dendrophila CBS 6074]|uniref:Bromo domain-containing protein n=1 Tax=Kwoniella dendrophila CBS 6074 TaxID=1295534 RepID=A0AAX4K345_9TREE